MLLALGLLSFAYPIMAQGAGNTASVCRKGNIYCEYPGKCHDYIDSNNDNYCDRSIPASGAIPSSDVDSGGQANSDHDTSEATNISSSASALINSDLTAGAEAPVNSPTSGPRYNLLPIFFIIIIAYGTSYLLSTKKVINASQHRRIWNIALLVSAISMLILGLLLTLYEEYVLTMQMPFDLTFWHVEVGIIMGIIAAFHIAWHWRYYFRGNLRKP